MLKYEDKQQLLYVHTQSSSSVKTGRKLFSYTYLHIVLYIHGSEGSKCYTRATRYFETPVNLTIQDLHCPVLPTTKLISHDLGSPGKKSRTFQDAWEPCNVQQFNIKNGTNSTSIGSVCYSF